jgi:hypothetical protein
VATEPARSSPLCSGCRRRFRYPDSVTAATGDGPLIDALASLRAALTTAPLALEVADVERGRAVRDELVGQIDDYLVPRLSALDAPLLAVVGGSTGAGKSTLINSLIGAEVSVAGVLRPTTRSPVLVCNPRDVKWFEDDRILPGLARTSGGGATSGSTLQLVPHAAVPAGLALLDAPDIDSVVSQNRELAGQLLSAADVWLFVTSAARYADAVPWQFLHQARARSTALALVLDRVPPEARDDVPRHLSDMLSQHGLGDAPVFVVPETLLAGGLLPEAATAAVTKWVQTLAGDAEERARVVRKTLGGALDSLDERVGTVIAHVGRQVAAARELRKAASGAYGRARSEIEDAVSAGSLLRGEVLARWHEVVGTGDFMKALESRIGWLRDQIRRSLLGEPDVASEVSAALGGSVEAVVTAAADRAAERTTEAWRSSAAGRKLLEGHERALARSSPELASAIRDEIHAWQQVVLELVRAEGAAKRATGRALSLGVNAVGAAVMVAVFAQTGGLTGAEIAVAGGTATLSQKLLEALFGDQAVRTLARRARSDLLARVDVLLTSEHERFEARLAGAPTGPDATDRLRAAVDAIRRSRAP